MRCRRRWASALGCVGCAWAAGEVDEFADGEFVAVLAVESVGEYEEQTGGGHGVAEGVVRVTLIPSTSSRCVTVSMPSSSAQITK